MELPETRYAKTVDGIHIAYQVLGHGPVDLVYAQGLVSSIEYAWDLPVVASFFHHLGAFSRLIIMDRRGAGASDRFTGEGTPPLEVGLEDITAVLDAVGSERAAFFGLVDGALLACLYAATYPERTQALILFGPEPRGLPAPDYPWAWSMQEWDAFIESVEEGWGTRSFMEEYLRLLAPSQLQDAAILDQWGRYLRLAGSPASVASLQRMYRDSDIRSVLPSIQTPTLVVHRGTGYYEEASRYVAEHIPGARWVSLPGEDSLPFIDPEGLLGEIEEFLTGSRRPPDSDRVLATVLFTDIVGSTSQVAELGDRAWKELIERHHATVRALIARFRGSEVDTAGDGFFATFDGPARAVRCAAEIVQAVRVIGLVVRAGVHTGEVQTIDGKVGGLGVVIGARVAGVAGPAQVLVSQTVKDLVAGSGLVFEDTGEHELKGVPDRWHLYRMVDG